MRMEGGRFYPVSFIVGVSQVKRHAAALPELVVDLSHADELHGDRGAEVGFPGGL